MKIALLGQWICWMDHSPATHDVTSAGLHPLLLSHNSPRSAFFLLFTCLAISRYLGCCYSFCVVNFFLFLLSIYHGMEFLDQLIILCLSGITSWHFWQAADPHQWAAGNVWSSVLDFCRNSACHLLHPGVIMSCVLWLHNYLMATDAKCLPKYLAATCIASWKTCRFRSLPMFLIR